MEILANSLLLFGGYSFEKGLQEARGGSRHGRQRGNKDTQVCIGGEVISWGTGAYWHWECLGDDAQHASEVPLREARDWGTYLKTRAPLSSIEAGSHLPGVDSCPPPSLPAHRAPLPPARAPPARGRVQLPPGLGTVKGHLLSPFQGVGTRDLP